MKPQVASTANKIKLAFQTFRSANTATKMTAAGTLAVVALSLFLACSNIIGRVMGEGTVQPANITSQEEGLITQDMEEVALASEQSQLATSLMELLGNEDCTWIASDDQLCAMAFSEDGFTEYYGDIETECTVHFYEIEAFKNGRSGIWRVWYPDNTAKDGRFLFEEDLENGTYRITSDAFPGSQTFETKSLSSESMLD